LGSWLDFTARHVRSNAGRFEAKGAPVAEEVRAEMVANVWKIVVTEGQPVDDGDTLVILESMKMEIPVVAESAGTVSVKIAEGDVVQEGDLIAVIE
jgi:biotin carboxyl carrier protein